ncbi:MAG TPA: hypothetical protein DCE42_28890 [Myxococcales bacterium]|nr:hypothetical protein [Deltaproteobacteria bacterium]MBU51126.1 hypothetical protein [Deltaproteobacteria bacterium]HAA58814.1 hypothetical protein [Myxococcales bacterium]|tara:strand:+ start:6847 stop:8520 length:1674 start_codon:yes stop_codon:yes gene_type:complete
MTGHPHNHHQTAQQSANALLVADKPVAADLAPPPRTKDPMIGRQIGRFVLKDRIGRGGFGAVYKAEHSDLDTPYAIKVLNLGLQDNAEAVERFRREARAVASLDHPNVVRVIDFGFLEEEGFYYLVMEYLEGQNLQHQLKKKQGFTLHRIHNIAEQLCAAIQYVHAKGIIHRDIKPANIFLTYTPQGEELVKLIDFGVAAGMDSSQITQTGSCIGSPTYMSPEQAEGNTHYVDGRADLYSVAIILFEMLTGRTPFVGETFASLLRQHLLTAPPKLSTVAPHNRWAHSLENFFQQALEKYPEDRQRDAVAFWTQFQHALREQSNLSSEFLPTQGALPSPRHKETHTGFSEDDLEAFDTSSHQHKSPSPLFLLGISIATLLAGIVVTGLVSWMLRAPKPPSSTAPRTALLAKKQVRFTIHSSPEGADVWLNGYQVKGAQTPFSLRTSAGKELMLTLKLEGYETHSTIETLTTAPTQSKTYRLLALRTQPSKTPPFTRTRPAPPPRMTFGTFHAAPPKRRHRRRRKRRYRRRYRRRKRRNRTKPTNKRPFEGITFEGIKK